MGSARRRWLIMMMLVTVTPIVVLPVVALAGGARPAAGLGWLLVVGSSVHVASTGWFYSVGEARAHMRQHCVRFLLAPALLACGGAAAAAMLPARVLDTLVLALLGWQFVHFAKQNLGIVALTASSLAAPPMTRVERRALLLGAAAVVVALVAHPRLLGVAHLPGVGGPASSALFDLSEATFAVAMATGLWLTSRRPAAHRPAGYAIAYAASLLFFAPVWLFSRPYAAVAGVTIAHGLQYLVMVTVVCAGGPRGRARNVSLLVLADIAVLAGVALNRMSHFDTGGTAARAVYGVFLGLTAAHFVADAGLWRLRYPFPRAFLTRRLPYLLPPQPVRTDSRADVREHGVPEGLAV